MANIKSIQLLRNTSQLYASRAAALVALTGGTVPAATTDGTPVLARYKNESGAIITLVGYYAVSSAITGADTATTHMTVFDYEGNIADIEELKTRLGTGITTANTATAQLIALSGNNLSTSADTSVEGAKRYADGLIDSLDVSDTAVAGSYVSQVSETNGKISVSRTALPDAGTVSGDSKVVIDVTQDKGQITATAANITGVKLAGYVEGSDADIAATDTLGEALGKLQAQINAMDKSADVVAGQVVTTVTEEDGKVTETKANVKDLQLGGYSKSSSTGAIASTDTINEALSKLENKAAAITIGNSDHSINVTTGTSGTDIAVNIRSGERVLKLDTDATSGGIYTNINLVEITGDTLPAEVKVRYELRDSDDVKIGESIDIPKDSHIVSINYITGGTHAQNLEYVYVDVSGETQTTYVDMSELVLEAEFASGVTITNHIAHGVVDPSSEKDESNVAFLTVGASGFKVSGIKDAIDTKINKLDADVSGNSSHVTVNVVETNGIVTGVNVVEDNIANANDLDTLSGKTVTAVDMTGGTAAIAANSADGTKKITINTDGSQLKMTNYTKGSASGAVAPADSVNQAISKLEVRLDGELAALDADVSGNSTHVTVGVQEEDGKITGVTVSESNIANADDLAALSAKTVTELDSSNASISATSSATADGTVKYDIVTDASKVKMTGFTAETSGLTAITTASTITEAVKAIESEIIRNEEITSTALNDLEDRKAEKTDVNTMYNHLEDEIRELQSGTSADLADEIAARKAVDGQSGQRYVANASKKYISGATSLNDADILLNDAIENITGNWIEGVQINGVELTEVSNKVNAQFSASTTYSDSANAIVITQDSTTGGLTFALGTLDAGTY